MLFLVLNSGKFTFPGRETIAIASLIMVRQINTTLLTDIKGTNNQLIHTSHINTQ